MIDVGSRKILMILVDVDRIDIKLLHLLLNHTFLKRRYGQVRWSMMMFKMSIFEYTLVNYSKNNFTNQILTWPLTYNFVLQIRLNQCQSWGSQQLISSYSEKYNS